MTGKLVSSPRGTTYYWIERNKDPNATCIVFTHGLAVNHHLYDKQVPYFQRDYTVLTWDLPLHGRSRPYQEFSYAHATEELLAILKRENIEKAVFVGHAAGGEICQEFALRCPERMLAFIALGVKPFGDCFYSPQDREKLRKPPLAVKRLPEKLVQQYMAHNITETKHGYHNALAMLEKMSKREIINALNAAYANRFQHTEPVNFSCPVLLVVGALDYNGINADLSRKWSEKMGYPMCVLHEAAHNANADNYDEFNDVVNKFLHRNLKKNNSNQRKGEKT